MKKQWRKERKNKRTAERGVNIKKKDKDKGKGKRNVKRKKERW